MKFFTIGVLNSSEEEFFKKLTEHRIDTFCDIRRRRSVRGAEYKFVNSVRLQKNWPNSVSGMNTSPNWRQLLQSVRFRKNLTNNSILRSGIVKNYHHSLYKNTSMISWRNLILEIS